MATLIATVPIAVLTFQFDPYAQLFGDLIVRWGTIALVGVIVAALILAGIWPEPAASAPTTSRSWRSGSCPGAVIGGRLGYLLLHETVLRGAPRTGCSIRPSAGWSSGWPSSAAS